MKGTGEQKMGKPAGINHILFLYPFSSSAEGVGWEPVSYIPLTPVEQIQSTTFKSHLPVNTDPPLHGADYHIVYWHFILLTHD